MPLGIKTRSESNTEKKSVKELLGLNLCDNCYKCNEERLKILTSNVDESKDQCKVNESLTEIREIKKMMQENEMRQTEIDEHRMQMIELKNKLDDLQEMNKKMDVIERMLKENSIEKKQIQERLQENKQEAKKWSDLFTEKVETLATHVKKVQTNVIDAKEKIESSDEKLKRRNNIVIYNLPENSKAKDKDMILKLMKEITGQELDASLKDFFRMGKRRDDDPNNRPVLVKLENYTAKNLIMENSFKLKKSVTFKNVMLNHDMSKEEREECRKLISEKKHEISLKEDADCWGIRIKGQPGKFFAVTYKKNKNF